MLDGVNWPLDRNEIRGNSVRNTFGNVRRNRNGGVRPHQGWDFSAKVGTPIFAIAAGEVSMVRNTGGYGRHVILRFDVDFDGDGQLEKLYAAYCHLSRIDVKQGQAVKLGEPLGLTGESGNARGMPASEQHLHFEIRHGGPVTGPGLGGRMSPLVVFEDIPLRGPMYRIERKAG